MTQATAERPAPAGRGDLVRWAATQRATLRATSSAGEPGSHAMLAEPPPLRGVSARWLADPRTELRAFFQTGAQIGDEASWLV